MHIAHAAATLPVCSTPRQAACGAAPTRRGAAAAHAKQRHPATPAARAASCCFIRCTAASMCLADSMLTPATTGRERRDGRVFRCRLLLGCCGSNRLPAWTPECHRLPQQRMATLPQAHFRYQQARMQGRRRSTLRLPATVSPLASVARSMRPPNCFFFIAFFSFFFFSSAVPPGPCCSQATM